MTKLILNVLCKGTYNEKEANAFFVYGDASAPLDHHGKKLTDEPWDFINHLNTVVVPALKTVFKGSSYQIGTAVCDQGSSTYITLTHKNKIELSPAHLEEIKALINKMLVSFNMKKDKVTMFHERPRSTAPAETKTDADRLERKSERKVG